MHIKIHICVCGDMYVLMCIRNCVCDDVLCVHVYVLIHTRLCIYDEVYVLMHVCHGLCVMMCM